MQYFMGLFNRVVLLSVLSLAPYKQGPIQEWVGLANIVGRFKLVSFIGEKDLR